MRHLLNKQSMTTSRELLVLLMKIKIFQKNGFQHTAQFLTLILIKDGSHNYFQISIELQLNCAIRKFNCATSCNSIAPFFLIAVTIFNPNIYRNLISPPSANE